MQPPSERVPERARAAAEVPSDPVEREALVDRIERGAAPVAAVLGIVFVLVVIGENLATPRTWLATAFIVAGWAIWGFFVAEFLLRLALAPHKGSFLRRTWWQILFLLLPFLRFLQVVRLARVARAGRIVSSAVRGTRSAGRTLRSRIAWIGAVHVIVVLSSSQLLFEFARLSPYGEALYRSALAATSGVPLGLGSGIAKTIDVVLSLYSLVFFASAAATLGAYLVERRAA